MLKIFFRLIPIFILAGPTYGKLTSDPASIELFTMLGMEPFGRIVIGIVEFAAIILLLNPGTSPYGALLCLGVMIGAVVAHATVLGISGSLGGLLLMGVVAGVFCLLILYTERKKIPIIHRMFN